MCIAGSRRGSGESCYQELASEGRHQGHPQHPVASQIPQPAVKSSSPALARAQSVKEPPQERRTAEVNPSESILQNSALVRITDDDPPSSAAPAAAASAAPSSVALPTLVAPATQRGSTTTTTIRRLSDADRLLIEALETGRERTRHTGRFLTMHKRRRKRLTTRSLSQDPGILDDILHGQVQCLLQQSGSWRFNAFALETVTGGRSLPVLCVHLFHWYGLLEYFKLDVVRVWKLFNLIEEGYHSTNPYHNSIHATDVTQAMHCFLQEEKIRKNLSQLEIMASLIGAVTHDLDHPGVNQPFLVATSNHLAALYENTSVLENHHWRSAIGCLLESGVSEQLEQEVRPELERHISSLILATDITRQQEFLTRFKRYLDQNLLDMRRGEDRHFILQIALKCADISNPCRPWDISRKWSQKVCEEFFRQGDYERKLKLPVTPLCDRHTTSIPKIQAGFFKFVVTPLYEEWHRFLGTGLSVGLMNYLKGNQTRWEALIQQEAAEETKTEISELEEVENALTSEDEEAAHEDSGSIDLLLPDASLSRRPSLPGKVSTERVGRRHSVPLSVPKLLPISRTVIRRESLPTERKKVKTPLVKLEDQTLLGRSSLSLLSSRSSLHESSTGRSTERPVSAENLLPEPSIASITNSAEASRLSTVLQPDQKLSGQTKLLTRQQTFPPLQHYVRTRYMSTTAEMAQCSEALIEADSLSNSTPSPAIDASCSEERWCSPSESPTPGSHLTVSRAHKKDSESADSLTRRRGSALPELMRKREGSMLSPEHARRHSVQVTDPGGVKVTWNSQQSPTLNLAQCEIQNSVMFEPEETTGAVLDTVKVCPDNEEPCSDFVRTGDGEQISADDTASGVKAPDDFKRRFSIPVTNSTENENPRIRRLSAAHAVATFFDPVHKPSSCVGITPDLSPPRVPSGSGDSGIEPRRSFSDLTSDSVHVGSKRDSDASREKGAKILKLSVEPEMKENVDPRNADEGKTLPLNRRPSQGWARRRSSAPVGLFSKLDDVSITASTPRGDRYSRRGSVPTDITRHQNGGPNRSALGERGENVSSFRRDSLPQETMFDDLLDAAFFPMCEEATTLPDNNNSSSRVNDSALQISGTPYLRRGSVPADISELRRDVYNRNSVKRNRKKVLRRRSSGGPEMFAGGIEASDTGTWVRLKKDISRRDSIPEPLTKRRGSLPVDMVAISHAGSVPAARKSSLWRL